MLINVEQKIMTSLLGIPVEITPTRHVRQTAAMTLMMIVTSEYGYRVLERGSV